MKELNDVINLSRESDSHMQGLPRELILLIEDDEGNAGISSETMHGINGDVKLVKNAAQALTVIVQDAVSVILCNAQMHSQSGLEVVETIVRHQATRDIPIIFLYKISDADYSVFSSAKSAPVDYLTSPVNPSLLISKVNMFLQLKRQHLDLLRMTREAEMLDAVLASEKTDGHEETESQLAEGAREAQDGHKGLSGSAVVENRLAERMDAVTRLSSVVAHDFNNILAIILGNLELLEYENIEDEKVNIRLASIQKSSDRACMLTAQLLGISRQQPKRSVITNANDVLKAMVQVSVDEFPQNIAVTSNLDVSLWLTDIDPDDFQEALRNLIFNACESMPDGGGLVLKTHNVTLDRDYCLLHPGLNVGEYLELSITDTGRGIAADVSPFVFEPFFSTKEVTKGSGMGLTQVYGFCRRSKGHIRLQPGPNSGTTVRLCLPRA